MNHTIQKVYKIRRVKGPGNYNDDYYSVHVTGLSVHNNEICFEDNKRIAARLFFVDAIGERILRNFFGPKKRLRRNVIDNFGSYIGNNILKKASREGSDNSSVCDIFIAEILRDELLYVL